MKPALASVVLPVYRQADHIEAVVEAYDRWLSALTGPVELILVSNGPDDGSWKACQSLAKRFKRVRALRSEQGGWGRAVKLGLRAAKGSTLCFANSARTSPAELCQILLQAQLQPARVHKARRIQRGHWLRRAGSWLYNLECRWLLGTRSADVNGTPKAFPRSARALRDLRQDGDLLDAEFCALCAREGLGLVETPFFAQPRHGGASTTKLASAWALYAGVWRLWRRGLGA